MTNELRKLQLLNELILHTIDAIEKRLGYRLDHWEPAYSGRIPLTQTSPVPFMGYGHGVMDPFVQNRGFVSAMTPVIPQSPFQTPWTTPQFNVSPYAYGMPYSAQSGFGSHSPVWGGVPYTASPFDGAGTWGYGTPTGFPSHPASASPSISTHGSPVTMQMPVPLQNGGRGVGGAFSPL